MDLFELLQQRDKGKMEEEDLALRKKRTESDVASQVAMRNNLAEQLRMSQELFGPQLAAAKREESGKAAMQPYGEMTSIPLSIGEAAMADPEFRKRVAQHYGKPLTRDTTPIAPADEFGNEGELGQRARLSAYNQRADEVNPLMEMIVAANKPGAREGAVAGAKASAELPSKLREMQAALSNSQSLLAQQLAGQEDIAGMRHETPPTNAADVDMHYRDLGFNTALQTFGPKVQSYAASARDPQLLENEPALRGKLKEIDQEMSFLKSMRDSFAESMPGGVNKAAATQGYNQMLAQLQQIYSQLWNTKWGKKPATPTQTVSTNPLSNQLATFGAP